MKKAVLFIISAFIFTACAPKLTVKEFNGFLSDLKKARAHDAANFMNHVDLTRGNMQDIAVLKKELGQAKFMAMMAMMQNGKLFQAVVENLAALIKALENKGIKLTETDLQNALKQVQENILKKRLQEKQK